MGAPASQTGPSQAEPDVSALRASVPSAGMVVLVTGGRTYDNAKQVNKTMAALQEKTGCDVACVVQGGARGADDLARRWAENRGIPVIEVRANWNRHGKRAGPIRNAWMLQFCRPDHVVAFPGSAGTAHMVRIAGESGLPILFAEGGDA